MVLVVDHKLHPPCAPLVAIGVFSEFRGSAWSNRKERPNGRPSSTCHVSVLYKRFNRRPVSWPFRPAALGHLPLVLLHRTKLRCQLSIALRLGRAPVADSRIGLDLRVALQAPGGQPRSLQGIGELGVGKLEGRHSRIINIGKGRRPMQRSFGCATLPYIACQGRNRECAETAKMATRMAVEKLTTAATM